MKRRHLTADDFNTTTIECGHCGRIVSEWTGDPKGGIEPICHQCEAEREDAAFYAEIDRRMDDAQDYDR